MTDDERELLIVLARWVAQAEDNAGQETDAAGNGSAEIRRLIKKIRPRVRDRL